MMTDSVAVFPRVSLTVIDVLLLLVFSAVVAVTVNTWPVTCVGVTVATAVFWLTAVNTPA
ncbi:MAG: hypothetical protein GIW95_01690 [Candidatus Eremiobacteraeota bacterium]|nr:hypothetical protein [Candidatus Eremiobacteraeota bacterium]